MPNPHHDTRGRFSSGGSGGRSSGERSPAQRHASASAADVSVDQLDKLSIRFGDPNESPYWPDDPIVSSLVKDIKKNGIKEPVTVHTDGKLGYVSDGNHRVAAAKIAGVSSIPTRFVRADSKSLEGSPTLDTSLQSNLAKNPSLMKANVPRQKSWSQNER